MPHYFSNYASFFTSSPFYGTTVHDALTATL